MKKIILMIMLLLVVMGSGAFAAESDDVFLRRDVFEARMDALEAKNQLRMEQILREIQNVKSELKEQIVRLDERTSTTQHVVYWVLSLLAVIIALPPVQKILLWWYDSKKRSVQSVTLEDVERLLNERLRVINTPQVVGK